MDMFSQIRESRIASIVAIYVIAALVALAMGLPMVPRAHAGLSSISDTISDSDLSAPADHTIVFTTEDGVPEGDTITLTFASGTLDNLTEDEVDVASSTYEFTTAIDCVQVGNENMGVTIAGQVITIEICSGDGGAIPGGTEITIEVGGHATASGSGSNANRIINPSAAGQYALDIATQSTNNESGQARIVVIDDVTVSAAVDATFSFSIAGLDNAELINGTSTTGTSTATTLPFGTLTAGTPSTLAQRLTVITNAAGGFVVTVQQDNNLQSSTGADIDLFRDGPTAGSSTPQTWAPPLAVSGDEWTYGHFGLTSEDSDLNAGEFGSDEWVGNLEAPRQVFSHDDVADGSTPDIGVTDVGYQIEISSFQEAGSDYSNTLTYVATPTF